jgi:hypothetical protein
MIEMLMHQATAKSVPPELENFFKLDGFTSFPGYTFTPGAGVAFEQSPSIDGATLGGQLGTVNTLITLNTPINLANSDFTLEYSCVITGSDVTYIGEVGLLAVLNANGLYTRYGSSGFGDRFQGINGTQFTNVFNTTYTKATKGTLKRIALVKQGDLIYLYYNGVKQKLASGLGTSYTLDGITPPAELSSIKYIAMGRINTSMDPCLMKLGPIRLSNYARYTADYTPVPF